MLIQNLCDIIERITKMNSINSEFKRYINKAWIIKYSLKKTINTIVFFSTDKICLKLKFYLFA